MSFPSSSAMKFSRTDYRSVYDPKDSMFPLKNSSTDRSQKYIPRQFKDKHVTDDTYKSIVRNDDSKRRMSVMQNPFQKGERKNAVAYSGELVPRSKDWDMAKASKKTDKKILALQEFTSEIPKLRQTKSTQCQTPKACLHSKVDEFHRIRLLGKGKFGDVYLVKHVTTGFMAAMKIINKLDLLSGSREENEKSINQLLREIKIQSFMRHPNLIQLYDFFSDEINVYLLLELACDGHLYEFLMKKLFFTEETTSILAREIIAGVDYMHSQNIIHRDLKLENIVLSHGMAKICDFGWSVYCPKDIRSTLCGTPIYLSPEIISGKSYNKKVDVWAIGALVHELFTSDNPFNIKTHSDLAKVVTDDFQMQVGSPEIRSFLTFILRKNPAKRPDSQTLKKHPFIQKYRDLQTSEELCKLVYAKRK